MVLQPVYRQHSFLNMAPIHEKHENLEYFIAVPIRDTLYFIVQRGPVNIGLNNI